MDGADIVVHCAAATKGSWDEYFEATVRGTERVFNASLTAGVKRVVYISSLSVYAVGELRARELVTEESPLDPRPQERGYYAYSKVEAEKIALRFLAEQQPAVAIIRPGLIYGPRGTMLSPSIGYCLQDKFFMTIGNGKSLLPMTYVENVVDAIWLAATRDEAVGNIYNIVDDELITQNQYVGEFIRRTGLKASTIHVPFVLPYLAACLFEMRAALTKGKAPLTRYRLVCGTKEVRYDTARARKQLRWSPRVSLNEGLARSFQWYNRQRQHT